MTDPWHPEGQRPEQPVPAGPASAPRADGREREWRLIENLLQSANDEQRRARRWGVFFKALTFAYLFLLLWLLLLRDDGAATAPVEEHVAVVDISGVIMPDGDADALAINSALADAFEAEEARAVILNINSPGGSPVQSGIVYDEIRRQRAKYPDKKVYAVIGDVGASGAYYIAAAADEIYVDKASVVGSIGVIMQGFGFEKLIEKLGIESRIMTAGENKNILDPFAPVSEAQRQHVQKMLDTIHAQFIQAVKDGRGERLKDNPDIFSGLFWTGEEAVRLGLADGLGTVETVARDQVGVEELYDYSYHPGALERLAEQFGMGVGTALAGRLQLSADGQPALR